MRDIEKSNSKRSLSKGSRADSMDFDESKKSESVSIKKSRKKSKRKKSCKK